MTRNTIQILRGASNYDPKNGQELLLDGQPFYSKKSKKLYIGDGSSKIGELKGTEIGLNLENATGNNTLKQIISDEDESKNPIVNGLGSVAFAGYRADDNIVNPLPEFLKDQLIVDKILNGESLFDAEGNFISALSDTTSLIEGIQSYVFGAGNRSRGAKWNFIVGKDNITFGRSNYTIGQGNINGDPNNNNTYNKSFSLVTGTSNFNLSRSSFLAGENNINTGNYSTISGKGILNKGNYSAIFGGDEISSALPHRIVNKGNNNFIFGKTSLNATHNNSILLGESLHTTNDNCVIVGKNSGNSYIGGNGLRFAVGTGVSPATGSNGFEVYEGGIVRVYRQPINDNEVARLKEIKELQTQISELSAKLSELENKLK